MGDKTFQYQKNFEECNFRKHKRSPLGNQIRNGTLKRFQSDSGKGKFLIHIIPPPAARVYPLVSGKWVSSKVSPRQIRQRQAQGAPAAPALIKLIIGSLVIHGGKGPGQGGLKERFCDSNPPYYGVTLGLM